MYIKKRYGFWMTVNWSKAGLVLGLVTSTVAVSLYTLGNCKWVSIPWEPLSIIGIALAFYLGFKNNSSYDRMWEARKIWGSITNQSRSLSSMVISFVSNHFAENAKNDEDLHHIKRKIIFRHLAWVTCLRFQLRTPRPWEHLNEKASNSFRFVAIPEFTKKMREEICGFIPEEELRHLDRFSNKAAQLLAIQAEEFRKLREQNLIDDFRHMELQKMISLLYDEQGRSERIKNFPFPRQYATAAYYFVIIFSVFLPFAMLRTFDKMGDGFIWMAIPFTAISTWVFFLMEMIGDYSENPFEGSYNDVPITSISRNIEIDLKEMLGEKEIPKPIEPIGSFLV